MHTWKVSNGANRQNKAKIIDATGQSLIVNMGNVIMASHGKLTDPKWQQRKNQQRQQQKRMKPNDDT